MLGLPVFSNRRVNLEDPREFTHAWAMQATLDLQNLAEFLCNHANESTLQPHHKSDLCMRIAWVRERFETLKTQQDRFNFNYFTVSKRSVKVFGKSYANYHVAAQRILFDTVSNVFFDAFSERLASKPTKRDVAKVDAVYVKRITDDFRKITNRCLENVVARFEDLQPDLENELGRCVKRVSSAAEKPEPAIPRWDEERRELVFRGELVKAYRQRAKNQIAILEAFEKENWPPCIDDPLPFHADADERQRLSDAVNSLNKNPFILFELDGTRRILWKQKPL